MTEREQFEAWWRDFHTTGLVSQKQYAWLVWQAARAQPAQEVPASCGECGKKASDGWALYCVGCMEKAGLPAQAGHEKAPEVFATGAAGSTERSSVRQDSQILAQPLLTDDELFDLWHGNPDIPGESVFPEFRDTAKIIEQAVRAKCGIVGKEGA